MKTFKNLALFVLTFLLPFFSKAVSTTFVSIEDQDITLKSVVITMGHDNVQGIYAKPLSEYLQSIISTSEFIESKHELVEGHGQDYDLDQLRENPTQTSNLIKKYNADGLLHLQFSKGQMGLRAEMGLFTGKSGLLWAYADNLETERFDLDYTKDTVRRLFSNILSQVPYQGLILSRRGNKVTMGRGTKGGVKTDQEIDIIQVVGVKRHPQFQFVTEVQKQIIGRIHVTKADETLSFGYIVFEKEPQSLKADQKLLITEPIQYPAIANSKNEPVIDHLLSRSDGSVMLQGQSKEWKPEEKPTFGRAHFLFGVGSFGAGSHFATSGVKKQSTLMAGNAAVNADFWLTQNWIIYFALNQGSADLKNPISGSSPNNISFALQNIKMGVGYDLGLSTDLDGPRIKVQMASSQFKTTVTVSEPTSFTGNAFSGTAFGITGYTPLSEEAAKWGLSAEFWYHMTPKLKESPLKSGKSTGAQMSQLAWILSYKMNEKTRWLGKYSTDTYRSSFTGTGTRVGESVSSSEITWRYLNFGLEYVF